VFDNAMGARLTVGAVGGAAGGFEEAQI